MTRPSNGALVDDFRELMLQLWRTNRNPWENTHAVDGSLYESVRDAYPPISDDRMLEAYLPKEERKTGGFGGHLVLYLPVITSGVRQLPLLRLWYDFARSNPAIPQVRIGIALYRVVDVPNVPNAIAMRYESPEGGGAGKHDFYHVQYITAFVKDGPTIRGCDPSMPVEQPSHPLVAHDAVELVLAMLVGLYGLTGFAVVLGSDVVPSLSERIRVFVARLAAHTAAEEIPAGTVARR